MLITIAETAKRLGWHRTTVWRKAQSDPSFHRYAKYFLFGYLFATWVNFATGYWSWRVVLDMFNGALMGYYMMTGFKLEARVLRDELRPQEEERLLRDSPISER